MCVLNVYFHSSHSPPTNKAGCAQLKRWIDEYKLNVNVKFGDAYLKSTHWIINTNKNKKVITTLDSAFWRRFKN